jgi:amino acid adenylation domain-containing protein
MFTERPADRLVDLPSKFRRYASAEPDAIALRWGGQPWPFGMLATRAARYTALLSERVAPGGWVGLCASRSPEVIALVLGAFAAGRAVVPIEPEHPVARLRLTLADAEPALLVTDHTAARELTIGYEADKALLDELAAEAMLYEPGGDSAPDPSDIAYVIYTSGSSGRPKGVMIQHQQLARLVEAVGTSEPVVAVGNTVLSVASLAFDMMVTDIFVSLANGASVALPPGGIRQREPLSLLDAIESHAVDTVYATPSLLQMLVLAGLGTGGRRRVRVITGGEAMSRGLAAELLDRCSQLYHGYGPTETTVYCSHHRVDDPGYLPLGKPTPGAAFYPVDEHLNVVPLNARAELAIGGSMVAAGYHNRARLTAERFRPDPYRDEPGARCYLSGDLVRVDNAGGAIFAGRKDTQVKVRGHRIELGEVEAAVLRQPGVRQCVAATAEDAAGNPELVAYLVGDGDPAKLRERLLDELPVSMVPTRFVEVDSIPLTVNGKPDREALGRAEAPEAAAAEDDAPATELETRISQLWGEVLGAESVGVNQGFFDLGGHSLLAMEIVARIRGEFGVDLPVWELFSVPTVRAWAAALAEAMQSGTDSGTDVRSAPVTYAQAALCVAEQVVPGVTSPGFVLSVDLRGELDVGELLAALHAVTDRHELLRTRFELRGVDSLQVVEPAVELDFDEAVCDDPAQAAATLRRWAARRFDLSTGPLFRALLLEEADAARTLHLCFHDAICDAASAAIVVSDLAAAYGAGAAAPEPAGSDAAGSGAGGSGAGLAFADLARAQRGQGAGAPAAELVSQWRSRLPKELPGQATRSTAYRTVSRRLVVSGAAHARLRELAARHETDLATILLDRLRTATGARVGGLLLSGRGDGVDRLVGPLASTLLVPFTGTGLAALRDDVAWAVAHAVPAELLALQLLGGERIPAVPDVAVAVRAPDAPVTSADQRLELRPRRTGAPAGESPARTSVALSVEIADRPDGGECPMLVQYRPDLVDESVLATLIHELGAVDRDLVPG